MSNKQTAASGDKIFEIKNHLKWVKQYAFGALTKKDVVYHENNKQYFIREGSKVFSDIESIESEIQKALTALDNLYDKAALIEQLEGMKMDDALYRANLNNLCRAEGVVYGNNTAIDAVIKAVREA